MAAKKWRETDFYEKSQVDSATNLQVRNFSNGFPDKCVLHFAQKFKMPTKKWRENDFCKMSPVHSADTLWVQNFVKIALSRTVSEINVLLRFTQKFKMAAKSGGKAIFSRKVASRLCIYPVGPKFRRNLSISHHFQDKCACVLHRNSRWLLKVAGKRFLLKVASRLFIFPKISSKSLYLAPFPR